jgi:hypothetical protein
METLSSVDLHKAHELAAEMVALAEHHESAEHLAQALGMRRESDGRCFGAPAVDFDQTIAIFESMPTAGQGRLLNDTFINPANARIVSLWSELACLPAARRRANSDDVCLFRKAVHTSVQIHFPGSTD